VRDPLALLTALWAGVGHVQGHGKALTVPARSIIGGLDAPHLARPRLPDENRCRISLTTDVYW
jgi:hypothetical protein